MDSFPITIEHWQAALEVPKEIALDVASPTHLRLQAARMVQAMLKILLKDAHDRDEPEQLAQKVEPQPVETQQPSSREAESLVTTSAPDCDAATAVMLPPTPAPNADQVDATGPAPPHAARDEPWHDAADKSLATVTSDEEPQATESPPIAVESAESRPRYIGRVGPRKIRGKRKK